MTSNGQCSRVSTLRGSPIIAIWVVSVILSLLGMAKCDTTHQVTLPCHVDFNAAIVQELDQWLRPSLSHFFEDIRQLLLMAESFEPLCGLGHNQAAPQQANTAADQKQPHGLNSAFCRHACMQMATRQVA
jgi:hypothetical protein